jgi:prepilin-type N-terminal cleavage/methylation domain-containing protein
MRQKRVRLGRGFSLIEIIISLGIFAVMALVFVAIFPVSAYNSQMSKSYGAAATLAESKMNEVEDAGFANLNATALGPGGRNVGKVESEIKDSDGFTTTTLDFTSTNQLWLSFAGGESLQQGLASTPTSPYGKMVIAPFKPSQRLDASGAKVVDLMQVTVTLSWKTLQYPRSTYTITSLIPRSPL